MNHYFGQFFFIFLIILVTQTSLHAQSKDTLNLLNGKVIAVHFIKQDSNFVYYQKKTQKTKRILKEKIFSLNTPQEKIIFYKPDTLANDLPTNEAEFYMKGQQLAVKYYKPIHSSAGAFLSGFAGSFLGLFYAPLVPSAFILIDQSVDPKLSIIEKKAPDMFNNENFVNGFKNAAKRQKVKRGAIGGVTGLVVGITTFLILLK